MFGIQHTKIIDSFELDDNLELIKNSLSLKFAGRSGKQVMQTADKNFIIKEIGTQDKHSLINLSENYL